MLKGVGDLIGSWLLACGKKVATYVDRQDSISFGLTIRIPMVLVTQLSWDQPLRIIMMGYTILGTPEEKQ